MQVKLIIIKICFHLDFKKKKETTVVRVVVRAATAATAAAASSLSKIIDKTEVELQKEVNFFSDKFSRIFNLRQNKSLKS